MVLYHSPHQPQFPRHSPSLPPMSHSPRTHSFHLESRVRRLRIQHETAQNNHPSLEIASTETSIIVSPPCMGLQSPPRFKLYSLVVIFFSIIVFSSFI
ncbi:hypothetical protein DL95DRAFT_379460, partial [Leptodontidium sp. 2 PMI_412]